MNTDLLILAKAIFAAGFRAGHKSGSDAAGSYEWGSSPSEPQKSEEAWKADVEWRLDADSSYKLDISNPDQWESVP